MPFVFFTYEILICKNISKNLTYIIYNIKYNKRKNISIDIKILYKQ